MVPVGNPYLLHIIKWTTATAPSCCHKQYCCVSILDSAVTWLIASSLSGHNLHRKSNTIIGYNILVTCNLWACLINQLFFVWLLWNVAGTSGGLIVIWPCWSFLSNPVQILVTLSKSFNSHQNGHFVSQQRLYGNKNISGSHLMPANLRWLESQCIRKGIFDSVKQAGFLYWCGTCLNLEKVLKFFDLISFQKGVLFVLFCGASSKPVRYSKCALNSWPEKNPSYICYAIIFDLKNAKIHQNIQCLKKNRRNIRKLNISIW